MQKRFTGLIAAVHTPMRADGALNLALARPVVQALVRDGVGALYVCGSTGESASLTADERRQTAAAFIKAARGRLPVIVHVGHNSLREAQMLAAHAQASGAAAIAAAPPSYFKPGNLDTLIAGCAEICAGAPGLPFFYYHIPALTGVSFSMVEFLRAARRRLPSLAGVKFTHADFMDYQQALEFAGGRYDLVFGLDEMLLCALTVGARVAIGSTYNYAAPIYRRMWDAFDRGDMPEARWCQSRAQALVRVLLKYPAMDSGKAVMKLIGLDVGSCRLPLIPLTGRQISALGKDLRQIGFFDWGRNYRRG